jgi:succinate-acetate transporter protein
MMATDISFSGLLAFACTNLILSLYNTNIASITTPNVIVGMCLFCGGLAQFVAGMWDFPRGNLFGATGKCPHLQMIFPEISVPCVVCSCHFDDRA